MAVSGRYKTPGSALGASTGAACTAIHNTANTVQIVEPNKKRRRGRRRIRRNRLTGSVIWGEDGKRISRTKEQNENRLDFLLFFCHKQKCQVAAAAEARVLSHTVSLLLAYP